MSNEEETGAVIDSADSADDVESDAEVLDAAQRHAIEAIQATGASEEDLPETYRLEGDFGGAGVDLELRAFRGGPFGWARVTRMRSERVQVLNVVLVPAADVAMPCFGAELLAFARGMHLVVVDGWATEPPDHDVTRVLQAAREDVARQWELEPVPDWGAEVFSADAIVVRPGARAEAPASAFIPAFYAVFDAIVTAQRRAPEDLESHVERRRKWLRVQGEEEPAGDFLARIAGEEWVERFTFDVLYPSWLYDGDGEPPWGSSS